jgi:hypothetical protein
MDPDRPKRSVFYCAKPDLGGDRPTHYPSPRYLSHSAPYPLLRGADPADVVKLHRRRLFTAFSRFDSAFQVRSPNDDWNRFLVKQSPDCRGPIHWILLSWVVPIHR